MAPPSLTQLSPRPQILGTAVEEDAAIDRSKELEQPPQPVISCSDPVEQTTEADEEELEEDDDSDGEWIECPACDSEFLSDARLRRHIR